MWWGSINVTYRVIEWCDADENEDGLAHILFVLMSFSERPTETDTVSVTIGAGYPDKNHAKIDGATGSPELPPTPPIPDKNHANATTWDYRMSQTNGYTMRRMV